VIKGLPNFISEANLSAAALPILCGSALGMLAGAISWMFSHLLQVTEGLTQSVVDVISNTTTRDRIRTLLDNHQYLHRVLYITALGTIIFPRAAMRMLDTILDFLEEDLKFWQSLIESIVRQLMNPYLLAGIVFRSMSWPRFLGMLFGNCLGAVGGGQKVSERRTVRDTVSENTPTHRFGEEKVQPASMDDWEKVVAAYGRMKEMLVGDCLSVQAWMTAMSE